ncbi:T9SS type A sorting domain-containing protein [Dokdonia pacifica]|uniref:Por secretion system C-terminal sorting domain-containing protein n=1 Tax=Dokdonia pacifica TaxID=1627892 RepID=A0A239AGL4_9FLAO|nr:T9SS type A sorting domain-containing protein [Dokdonia pacifica]SNR94073.1 Por secretion system C-terminal sorting domain-containing protein [Dokdonia pacifica]
MKKLLCTLLCMTTLWIYAQNEVVVTTITSEFSGSGGISIDSEGNLFIADFGDFLGMADPDGIPNNILQLDTDLNLTVYATDFIGASGNDFDSEGTLYQSDIRASAIYKIVDGERILVTATGIVAPVGIVFDSNDNFYVCNCGNNTIRKVTPDGTSTQFASGDMFTCPNGITVDEDDNLYVSNFANPDIIKITPDGTITKIGETFSGNGHIDYDPNTRNLYIASYGGHQIFYLNIDNPVMTDLAGTGVRGNDDGAGETATFSTPNGIAVSDDGTTIFVNCAVPLDGAVINPQILRQIDITLSVNDTDLGINQVKTYPNPVTDVFTIETELPINTNNITIKIIDMVGKVVMDIRDISPENTTLKQSIDISEMATGNYIYTISNDSKQLYSGQLIKK